MNLKCFCLIQDCNRGYNKNQAGGFFLGTCEEDCLELCHQHSNFCDAQKCYVNNFFFFFVVLIFF
jgi:hypothetical protein